MSLLEKYVERIKQKTEGYSELEKIRYVYIDLGQKFSFDLDFSFGNTKTKNKIYNECIKEQAIEKSMQNNKTICRSIAYILKFILKELGVNIQVTKDYDDYRKYPHIYNIIVTEDGKQFSIDLQEDLRNIKAHLKTTSFGLPLIEGDSPTFKPNELEKIDRKIGYVTKEMGYTNEYLELIKLNMPLFSDFNEKVQFVLENVEFYCNKDMQYAERKWRMEDIIGENSMTDGILFSKEERGKIHLIDCYKLIDCSGDTSVKEIKGCTKNNTIQKETEKEKQYELCIAVDNKKGTEIYMFSDEINSFRKMKMEEFAKLIENGLVPIQGVPGLKQYLKSKKKEEER